MEEQKGFRTVTIPARTYQTCRGCYHLGIMKTMFGHRDVKGSFHCLYPEKGGDMRFEEHGNGVYLGYGSISDEMHVPSSCPYLPENNNQKPNEQ